MKRQGDFTSSFTCGVHTGRPADQTSHDVILSVNPDFAGETGDVFLVGNKLRVRARHKLKTIISRPPICSRLAAVSSHVLKK